MWLQCVMKWIFFMCKDGWTVGVCGWSGQKWYKYCSVSSTDRFVSLDLNVSSQAAGVNLVFSVYVFFFLKAVSPIYCHYMTDRLQRFALKNVVCVLLKKKSHLHLGCPWGKQINLKLSFFWWTIPLKYFNYLLQIVAFYFFFYIIQIQTFKAYFNNHKSVFFCVDAAFKEKRTTHRNKDKRKMKI